ncbi:phosphatase PAP2 family protein [Pandoraea commovens]|uniref:Phosphatase PAP2 family protein n=1 Tax=Pandoraea commovens TaxID=2508289 RepID=A0ABY5QMJ3_9BURK|nr:phosphatase PAP2 family protein [Pandoraea commovens]UVA81889.1 phosphatase PAP2 family protein [Pandoraea commovens]
MEHLNDTLFLLLNARALPTPPMFALATFLAQYLILAVPVGLVVAWMRVTETQRRELIAAAVAGVVGLALNQAIGWVWQHPRPFVMGIGHTYLAHAADSSFPSDHLTLIWSVAFALVANKRTRIAGIVTMMLGVSVAWARIFLGVHFPLDMVGSVIVAGTASWLVTQQMDWLLAPAFRLTMTIYHKIFARFIDRGWVRA